jgi:hypothetical protein
VPKVEEITLSTYARPSRNEWTVDAYTANGLLVGTAEFVGVYERREIDEIIDGTGAGGH